MDVKHKHVRVKNHIEKQDDRKGIKGRHILERVKKETIDVYHEDQERTQLEKIQMKSQRYAIAYFLEKKDIIHEHMWVSMLDGETLNYLPYYSSIWVP